ncbi:membrane-associated progesterone receptor component 1 [Sclerotinia borealis F-4128]|uniref:Membrane-associated progesterone receptor component 1 n=1 Tax=Sclerotinia borealis (strain F-4128) TaxID=1432307 RepID=W9CI53_SCLBF|nr:membrane-associated progesterone receptor component 1 [Sclerotinia borealis F-4128]
MEYVEKRMAAEAQRPAGAEVASLATPLNLLLLSLLALLTYTTLRPKKAIPIPVTPSPIVFRTFTPPELAPFSGLNNTPVYLAVRGRVFDVSNGRNFYGPGGPYENFAGRDASRGLAKGSFDAEMLTEDLEGSLDTLENLDAEELDALRGWEERFEEKYLVVGRLISCGEKEREEKEKGEKA